MLTKAKANTAMRRYMRMLSLSFFLIISGAAYGHSTQARLTAARLDFAGIKVALDVFSNDCGRYPTTSEGFVALLNCPTNISPSRWRGPYLDRVPIDPWGTEYVYRCPGIHNTNGFDLYSCGLDGISKSGGADPDDINNWDPGSPHGGDYGSLSFRDLVRSKLNNSPAIVLFILISQIIPLFGMARLVTAIFSQRVRDSVARHPIAHVIWLVASFVSFLLLLACLIPPRIET